MKIAFAPMEGLTGALYRQAHCRWFGGVDRYFIPFITPTQDHRFTKRELREILPEHNGGLTAVPQLLVRRAEDFLWAAGELAAMGYPEINLNLGCPSGSPRKPEPLPLATTVPEGQPRFRLISG